MTEEDIAVSEEEAVRSRSRSTASTIGCSWRLRSDAYDRFYNVDRQPDPLVHPALPLEPFQRARTSARKSLDAWELGYQAVNADIAPGGAGADRGARAATGDAPRLPPPHGAANAARRPRRLPPPLRPHPLVPARQLATLRAGIRRTIFEEMLANDIIGFHTHAYCINFLRCCDELLDGADVDYIAGRGLFEVIDAGARRYRSRSTPSGWSGRAASAEVAEAEREVLERRRKHLIIRVDGRPLEERAGGSPPSTSSSPGTRSSARGDLHRSSASPREDVPEYAEYLERIEALVAVVNQRHGDHRLDADRPEDLRGLLRRGRRYKHFDLLMVELAVRGMDLVAKEARAVSARDGVLMLSENSGSHHELSDL